MGMQGSRPRQVVVEGVTYEVVTGVSWAKQKRYWSVSRQVDGVQLWWRFHPIDYGNDVAKALAAAITKAHEVRTTEVHDLGGRHTTRCLGDNPPLPTGLYVHRSRSATQTPEFKLVVKKVGEFPSRSFVVGPTGTFTQRQYDEALEKALAYRQQILLASSPVLQEQPEVSTEELNRAWDKLQRNKMLTGSFPTATFSHKAA